MTVPSDVATPADRGASGTAGAAEAPIDPLWMRQRASSGSPFEATIGFSRGVRVGPFVSVSGTAPIRPDGTVDADAGEQTRRCFEIILAAIAQLGGRPDDVTRTRMYITDAADADAIGRAHGEIFGSIRPASTMVVVAALLDPRWKVEIEADALVAAP